MRPPQPTRRATLAMLTALLATGTARASTGDASAPIHALDSALLAIMRAGKAKPFAQRFDMLAPAVDQAFNLEAILQAAVGPRWTALPAADQEALRAEFRSFTIASWVANFDSFTGETFNVQPETRALGDGAVVVQTRLAAPGAAAINLDYVMRQDGTRWRAVDVLAEGTISRVAVMRSDFRHVLAQGGGPALLARLREKVAALTAGKSE